MYANVGIFYSPIDRRTEDYRFESKNARMSASDRQLIALEEYVRLF